jgi:hypothetical protein
MPGHGLHLTLSITRLKIIRNRLKTDKEKLDFQRHSSTGAAADSEPSIFSAAHDTATAVVFEELRMQRFPVVM